MRWAVAVVLVAASAWAAPMERFFVMGDGRLALVNAHTDARVDVRYRRADGSYDSEALAKIRQAFRSKGDDGEGRASLRLIEILSYLQKQSGARPLTLMSGYRSPEYNEGLRSNGAKAASGSLHTEGLAADVAFPKKMLRPLWMKLRGLECCGAGYYAKEGFLHIDVGRPRFWEPQTSRVEENLSAGNAKLFARTEYDRYRLGEELVVSFHSLTLPPIRVGPDARFSSEGGDEWTVRVDEGGGDGGRCLEIPRPAATIRIHGLRSAGRGRAILPTCEPRTERTPPTIETNSVEVR